MAKLTTSTKVLIDKLHEFKFKVGNRDGLSDIHDYAVIAAAKPPQLKTGMTEKLDGKSGMFSKLKNVVQYKADVTRDDL